MAQSSINFLNDKNFLKQLDNTQNKHIYARIIALDINDLPQQIITGRVTQGSISIDGSSAVRRSCSLTLVTELFDYQDYYWAHKTRFKLEVGIENFINPNYPDICWFKQGVYVINSINTSRSTNQFTLTIQGKDKMSLINGDLGGSLEAQTDFGKIEEENSNGEWVIRSIPLQDIIRNILHQYAKEPYHNIIINDLDSYGLELLEYRYDKPIYLIRTNKDNSKYQNVLFSRECSIQGLESDVSDLQQLDDVPLVNFDSLMSNNGIDNEGKIFLLDGDEYRMAKIQYGDTAGYRITELTYAGDLVGNVGESLTSILDKIKNMLVEFEYFYDIDGHFVFQKKQSFLNTIWTPGDYMYKEAEEFQGLTNYNSYVYNFDSTNLFTALNINPNILNVRNDFSIWGERTSVNGTNIPIHLRYAIDTKPQGYTNIEVSDEEVKEYNDKYNTTLKGQTIKTIVEEESPLRQGYKYQATDNDLEVNKNNKIFDWREIIYQMALDYFRYNWLEDFEDRVAAANSDLYPTGRTGYEQYYTDLQGFWRQIYNPYIKEEMEEIEVQKNEIEDQLTSLSEQIGTKEKELATQRNTLIEKTSELSALTEEFNALTNLTSRKDKYTQMYNKSSEREQSRVMVGDLEALLEELNYKKTELENSYNNLQSNYNALETDKQSYEDYHYWNPAIYESPETLNFWFDFLDSQSELYSISVPEIGPRTKAINDNSVKSIYNRNVPSIIFTSDIMNVTKQFGNIEYNYIQINDMDSLFSISAQGKSAKDKLDELLYQHSYVCESVSITSIPIYYLEPNVRIHIKDEETNIDGDYILSKITIPLAYNGTMSLTATKAAEYLI